MSESTPRAAVRAAIVRADDAVGEVDPWKSDTDAWADAILDALLASPELPALLVEAGRAEQVEGWRIYKDMPHEEESECDEIGPYCDRLFRFLPPVSPDPEGEPQP